VPYIVSTNVLNAHARVVQTYRKRFQPTQKGKISITLNCEMAIPLTDDPADIAAAERALEFWLMWWLQPILTGEYPPAMRANVGARLPTFTDAEKELLIGSLDVLGINHYSTHLVRNVAEGERGDAVQWLPYCGWDADQKVAIQFGDDWPQAASPWQRSSRLGSGAS